MKRPAPSVPGKPAAEPAPQPGAPGEEQQAGQQAGYFDSFYNWAVPAPADPNAPPPAEGEQDAGYWGSLVNGMEYTKESVGAVMAYSYPAGAEGAEGAPPAEGAEGAEGQQGAWSESMSSWYYGKEPTEEGGERQPGFQDTVGYYSSYVYAPGEPGAEGEQPPVDPNAPYLGGWFLPKEEEGQPPVQIEKVDLDGMVTGLFTGTGTYVQKLADYGPSPPPRAKPPAGAAPAAGSASSGSAPAAGPAPRRPPPKVSNAPPTVGGRAPPPRPSAASKGLIAGAPSRPVSARANMFNR